MAFNPGRNIGRVSIRVVPDTRRFREDLRRQLATIEKTTSMTVRVDKANVDRNAMRESIRRQMADFKDLQVDSAVQVIVDKVKVQRGKVRKSIQRQFDEMGDIRVGIESYISNHRDFDNEVRQLVDHAERHTVDIAANARTLEASAQLRYVTRPRFVDIFVRLNKRSVEAALTTLAALSGARLTFKWLDSLLDKIRNLDKTLPTLIGWTTGITSLVGAIGASISGLVGLGQGLFSILPAFLVVPGLLLNSLGSLAVLIVALKNAKTELAELGDDFNSLGTLINTTFWDRARQPILDLVNGLMPQMRNAFTELSAGVGDFTGALANAFSNELGNGRFEAIFANVAEGWRILATGADGFAGAITSLSQIAARYTPRLAGWFVRQANTFDSWLNSIANDGRLDAWMEQAIDSMYDLWDATTGFSGVLAGIWRAADQAGSTGLAGFAQMMQRWEQIANGPEFQRGLTAIFRGSYVAMDAFGGAVESIGRLIGAWPDQVERFVGATGTFLGGLIDGVFRALNTSTFANGLDGLSSGLLNALDRIKPSLQPIADTFGNLLGLLGDMAQTILPTAAGVLADLMPSFDALIRTIRDSGILDYLADAVGRVSDILSPAIQSFVEAVSPALVTAMETLADVLAEAAPTLASLVEALGPAFAGAVELLVGALEGISSTVGIEAWGTNPNQVGLDILKDPSMLADAERLLEYVREIQAKGGLMGALFTGAEDFGNRIGEWINYLAYLRDNAPAIIRDTISALPGAIEGALNGLAASLENAGRNIQGWLEALPGRIKSVVSNAGTWLTDTGFQTIMGLIRGFGVAVVNVTVWLMNLPNLIRNAVGGSGGWLFQVGVDMINGLVRGIQSVARSVANAARSVVEGAVNAAKSFLNINSPSRVTRDVLGKPWGEGVAVGILSQRKSIVSAATDAIDPKGIPIPSAGAGADGARSGTNVYVTQPLLPGETPQEQRDNLVRELQLAL